MKIMFEHKDTRAFRIVGVIFYDHGFSNTGHYIFYKNIILNQLVVPMNRYSYLSMFD